MEGIEIKRNLNMTLTILPKQRDSLAKVCAELGYKAIFEERGESVEAYIVVYDLEIALRLGFLWHAELSRQLHKEIYGE